MNQKLWVCGPAARVLTSPPGDSDTPSSLRTPRGKGFPGGSGGKESACNVGDLGSILGLGRSSEAGNDYPLQYPDLENSMELYSPRGCKESDTTERLSLSLFKGKGEGCDPEPRWVHTPYAGKEVSLEDSSAKRFLVNGCEVASD